MKSSIALACALFLMITLCSAASLAQSGGDIKTRVEDLVGKHYMDGIPYPVAHALGPEALPYLFELLGNTEKKTFWVNIIVTIGFIEDSSAVSALIAFLENAQGEVDSYTFRALLSVPYALGCIASGGDARALRYLADNLKTPRNVGWSFRGKPIADLIVEQSVMGLGISGRPEARTLLMDLKAKREEKTANAASTRFGGNVDQALTIMDRITTQGRPAVLNPNRGQ